MIVGNLEDYINNLIRHNKIYLFYLQKEWKNLSKKVLKDQHYECQDCKKKGLYSRATAVHHEHEVREFPELALSEYDHNGNRNLTSLCDACHDARRAAKEKFVNEERWD